MENQGLPTTRVPRYFSVPQSYRVPAPNNNTDSRPAGLKNLGSTCWFNVAVQVLYHIPALRQMILELRVPSISSMITPSMEVLSGLQELFISIMYSERKLIDPTRAVNSIGKLLGQGQGQQDASEFLGIVLSRIREISPPIIENLFIGSSQSMDVNCQPHEFMQYTLQVNEDTSLMDLLELSLKPKLKSLKPESANIPNCNSSMSSERSKQFFSNIPPVFLIDLSRLISGTDPTQLIRSKHRMTFPSLIFMDRFLQENYKHASKVERIIESMWSSKKEIEHSISSMTMLQQKNTELQNLYKDYQNIVEQSLVNFDLLRSLHLTWETEIQLKICEYRKQSNQLKQQLDHVRSRELQICRPYQLHAVIVHTGKSDSGHYWVYIWDSQQKHWYHIDDNFTRQVTWDTIVSFSFGGANQESSAHSLVYIDAPKTYSLLDIKEEYDIGPTDVLRYLKDHTDVRTRHSAYGKSQTIAAVHAAITAHGQKPMEPFALLFRALDGERQRLFAVCQESTGQNGEEGRLLHFGVYLLANQVEFEPFVYWSLLQHFSSFALLVEEGSSRCCTAARRTLAFVECSTTQEQKKIFIQWNTAYYQFRLIIRHVMNGITQVFSRSFSAAVPLAVKSLYLHHCLMNSSLGGPAMSVNPGIIHALIEKSVTALSEELLESDLETVVDLACSVLFDAVINWCEYADANYLEAARCSSRRIAEKWNRKMKHYFSHPVECASASSMQTFEEVQRKLLKVESVLNQKKGNPTPFDFKGHIPESPEDGEKLALKWKQMWLICTEQRILGP